MKDFVMRLNNKVTLIELIYELKHNKSVQFLDVLEVL